MSYRLHVMVCTCTNCISNGALKIKDALESEIAAKDLVDDIRVVQTGASGMCVNGPILMIQPDGIFYQYIKEKNIAHLVEEHFLKGRPVKSLMYVPEGKEVPIPKVMDIPFFKDQRLLALRNRGLIDPDNIEEYIANDGYEAIAKVLANMTPEQVVEEIKQSGLRGRGGGGFPTGRKWETCLKASGDVKYIICNADEGDPGAFMDRSILEADPHSVIEGMCIGAYAIGATKGYIYVRIEYPLAIKRIENAIEAAKEYGLLGKNILGFDFDFDLMVFQGAGAFICGESTTLMKSIEGRPPEPRPTPPRSAVCGLWGMPTALNNVETLANLPPIINKGAAWFASMGTEKSKGTKVFSLAGNVNNAGLVEVPMGITLREIVYNIGGGIPYGKKFKAVQTGGPSGGCIPASLLDLPIDYESLTEAGSMMGSGGMIVLDEDSCMVDIAKYFLKFTSDESCGKCSSCREGSLALLEILERICAGEGEEGYLELLVEISNAVKDASMCDLGRSLPNPILCTIKYFKEEYETHIREKKCPAKVCKALITFTIDPQQCVGCGACLRACPANVITGEKKEPHIISQENCIKCGLCKDVCKFDAVKVE